MQMFQAVYVYKVLIECVLNLYYPCEMAFGIPRNS